MTHPRAHSQPQPNSRFRQHSFPLGIKRNIFFGPELPEHLQYRLQASYYTDGGSKAKKGSWAAVVLHHEGTEIISGLILAEASNNVAEFTAILKSLQHAIKKQFLRILIATDSELAADFLKGISKIDKPHLVDIASQIVSAIASLEAVYVSHVPAHSNLIPENDVADAICTWILNSNSQINITLNSDASNLARSLKNINSKRASYQAECSSTSNRICSVCLKTNSHHSELCPLITYADKHKGKAEVLRCPTCMRNGHAPERCLLSNNIKRKPMLSSLHSVAESDIHAYGEIQDINALDIEALRFPQRHNRQQFLDFMTTVVTNWATAEDEQSAAHTKKVARLWADNYSVEKGRIWKRKESNSLHQARGSNMHPDIPDPEIILANRALRTAFMIPHARISDVSKALRKAGKIALDEATLERLAALYPEPAVESKATFPPKPLLGFTINRHAVAKAVMSRSPNSHPGPTGLSFGVWQHFCNWTYKLEDHNKPDPRWTVFCELIAKIMSGNAPALSAMFQEVAGAAFDKNADIPGAPVSLRNIGIEESLVRIAAALVFDEVVQDAIDRGFISSWDFGTSRKHGAEIFGRIATMAAEMGSIVAAFDIIKAFNNIRREDVKGAVDELNIPLLTAFVYFLFGKNPHVVFKDGNCVFIFELKQGILQGNPLSVFLFSLTIAYILKNYRKKHMDKLKIPAYVDDLLLVPKPAAAHEAPELIAEFIQLFNDHGLRFDMTDSAKTSVFSKVPLHPSIQHRLQAIGIRTQQRGIAPCKVPYGTEDFIKAHVKKQMDKFEMRFKGFEALWPALLKRERLSKKPCNRIYESFLMLIRLSLLSMPMYTLRTTNPLHCAPYSELVSRKVASLIENVFPPFIEKIGKPIIDPTSARCLVDGSFVTLSEVDFPPMMSISLEIMQLPLSMGGLGVGLPDRLQTIPYAASCGDCLPTLRAAAAALNLDFNCHNIPGYVQARSVASRLIADADPKKMRDLRWERKDAMDGDDPLQQVITALLNESAIVRIRRQLAECPIYRFAFEARTHNTQYHCSWNFNPKARENFNIDPLSDADFSRAVQIAVLRPITLPRRCDCGGVIDPVALHVLACSHVHQGYLHNTIRDAIASTIASLLPKDLAPLAVQKECQVNRFYPLKELTDAEGPELVADLAVVSLGTAQLEVGIVDVSSTLARTHNRFGDFNVPLDLRSKEKRRKYSKYAIQQRLFHPVSVGRTNVLGRDALVFIDFIDGYYAATVKAGDKLRAAIGRAIVVGAARTMSMAIRRAQLAAFNACALSAISGSLFFDPQSRPDAVGVGEVLMPVSLARARSSFPVSSPGPVSFFGDADAAASQAARFDRALRMSSSDLGYRRGCGAVGGD